MSADSRPLEDSNMIAKVGNDDKMKVQENVVLESSFNLYKFETIVHEDVKIHEIGG